MKKILCTMTLLVSCFIQAQILLTDYSEEVIPNDFQFTTNAGSGNLAQFNFYVTNTSDATIKIKIRVDEITNSSGQDFQLCFGNCYTSIEEGESYPPLAYTLNAGAMTAAGDHFINSYEGDDAESPVSAKFTFVQVDDAGNVLEELYKINYQYVPQLSISEVGKLKQMGISNINTLVDSQLYIDASESATMEIFNLNGQLVRAQKLEASQQSINVADLSPAMYLVRFTGSNNKSAQIKIAKK